jgi:hypothetical protein
MNVLRLIAEVRTRVPIWAPFGTRWKTTSIVSTPTGSLTVAVAARIDARGQRREQFWCDGTRVEQPVLLRLTCAEAECPQAIAVRAQWRAYHKRGPAKTPIEPPRAQPLMHEAALNGVGQQVVARPARFPCLTPCPHKAHPPLTIDKTGFDLFEDGRCLVGGVTEIGGVRRPRIASVRAAEAFVLARRLEMLAVLEQARQSSRPHPGSSREAG